MNALTARETLATIAKKAAPRRIDADSVKVDYWPATAAGANTDRAIYRVRGEDLLFTVTLGEDGRPVASSPGNAESWEARVWERMVSAADRAN